MINWVQQSTQDGSKHYSEQSGNVLSIDLQIDEFDQWSNPRRLRLGPTGWTKAEACEEPA